jgi:hypothetical protein
LYDFCKTNTIYVIDTSAQPVSLKTNTIMIKVHVKKDDALVLEDEKGVIDCAGGTMISYTKKNTDKKE